MKITDLAVTQFEDLERYPKQQWRETSKPLTFKRPLRPQIAIDGKIVKINVDQDQIVHLILELVVDPPFFGLP